MLPLQWFSASSSHSHVFTLYLPQVLTILLNLSSQQELVSFLVGSDEVLRLLTLASNSFSPELSTLAADTLGNLAKEVCLCVCGGGGGRGRGVSTVCLCGALNGVGGTEP